MKIETFKISIACKDDARREDLAASIFGSLNRNLMDTTYAYAAEVDGTPERKAPETATGKSSCEDLLRSALARVVEHAHSIDGDTTWTHAIRGEDYDFAMLVLSETGKQ